MPLEKYAKKIYSTSLVTKKKERKCDLKNSTFFLFYFIFRLYITVLVLSNIKIEICFKVKMAAKLS